MSSRPLSTLPLPPSTLSALTRAGYETLDELLASAAARTPEALAQDLHLPLAASQAVFAATHAPRAGGSAPMTQSAASLAGANAPHAYSTQCAALDALLGGGLRRGHILELSGPPGCPKERLALGAVRSFAAAGEGVLFVDMQNMTSPALLSKALQRPPAVPPAARRRIQYLSLNTLPDLMVFLRNLDAHLQLHPDTGLLVLNSLSFPFQATSSLPPARRGALLATAKQTLARACAARRLAVAITGQLATKMVDRDGAPATYDTSARAVVAPQLGNTYLPSGRTHRVIVVPETRTAGVLRLLSSPSTQMPGREERYELMESEGTLR